MEDDLANSIYFQQGDFLGNESQGLVLKKFDLYQSVINRLFVLNSNDIVTTSLSSKTSESFMSQDFSVRDWVQETKNKLTPVFSGGFERQGIYRIFISYPIINLHTNKYMGMVVASIPTITFFAHYGDIEHVNSEFLIAFDKKVPQKFLEAIDSRLMFVPYSAPGLSAEGLSFAAYADQKARLSILGEQ